MPTPTDEPPNPRRQRWIALATAGIMTAVYLSLVLALRWAPGMKPTLQSVVIATLIVPVAAYLVCLPAIFLSERFHRLSGPVFAFGLGLVVASLIAYPFLATPPGP
jgi:hypothetical protein